jgi:hypothetical protein
MISPPAKINHWNRLISTLELWKNKLIKLKRIGHCDWVTEHVVILVCTQIQLQTVLCRSYNMIFIT